MNPVIRILPISSTNDLSGGRMSGYRSGQLLVLIVGNYPWRRLKHKLANGMKMWKDLTGILPHLWSESLFRRADQRFCGYWIRVRLKQAIKELELEQEHSFLVYECSFQRLNQTNKELELEQEHSFLVYECSFQRLNQTNKELEQIGRASCRERV